MTTQDSQSKYDERKSLSIKIAKQIFPILHPYGVKRTQGEKNEDAHYIEQQVYHENIMKYIDDYVTTRVKEATDEPYAILRGLRDRLLEAKKQGRQYIRVSNLEYSMKKQLEALTTTTNGKEE